MVLVFALVVLVVLHVVVLVVLFVLVVYTGGTSGVALRDEGPGRGERQGPSCSADL